MPHPPSDVAVRLHIYRTVIDTATAPTVRATARALGATEEEVAESYHQLAAGKAIVLRPGAPDAEPEVLMAPPWSAVPTDFAVFVGRRRYWGNCVWDALGVAAALGRDARVETDCADCGAPMHLTVAGGRLVGGAGVAHFALPVRRWWEDVVFT